MCAFMDLEQYLY